MQPNTPQPPLPPQQPQPQQPQPNPWQSPGGSDFYGQPSAAPQAPPPSSQPQPFAPQPSFSQPTQFGAPPQSPQQPTPQPPRPTPKQGPVALILPLWIREHWKWLLIGIVGAIIVLTIAGQLIYPSNYLVPGTKVDGVDVGGMRKKDAAAKIDGLYGELKLAIYFGKNQAAFQEPKFKDVGIGTDSTARLEKLEYPWYLRLIPSSIFWVGGSQKAGTPEYVYDKAKIDSYTQSKVGNDCVVPAQDATLKLVGDKLQLVPSQPGGICDITKFQQVLATTEPKPADNKVVIDIKETPAMVGNDKAQELADALNDRTTKPMPISVLGATQTISGGTVLGWLDFKSFVPEQTAGQTDIDKIRDSSKLTFTVNTTRMATFMQTPIASKVAIKPGVTKISTSDFTVNSKTIGQTGRELDAPKTALTVENYLNKKSEQAVAETKPVAPTTSYTRSYSNTSTGFAALLAQWPEEHPGTYAATVDELTGTQPFRAANYRGDQQMTSAGTEGVYVYYAVLMGLQNSSILANDKIVGTREVNQCLADMIERTDLACSNAFMSKIGHETMVSRGKELGLKNTTFAGMQTKTSTNDLALVLKNLFFTKVATSAGGGRIMGAMQNTRMSDAIPAGIAKGTVANVAGEAGKVHNDAAIIYSPKGVYVLAIQTEGASRADIAELTKKVEALHQISPPRPKK